MEFPSFTLKFSIPHATSCSRYPDLFTLMSETNLPLLCYCSVYTEKKKKGLDRYRKIPKYSDIKKIRYNYSKILTMWLYHRVMSPNDADGMANSVDPDQIAPLGAV